MNFTLSRLVGAVDPNRPLGPSDTHQAKSISNSSRCQKSLSIR